MARIGGLLFLKDSEARSLALARSGLMRALVAKPAALYELATGQSALGVSRTATSKNPQGLLGVSLSGPPWGPAILHPIAAFPGLASTTGVQAPAGPLNLIETTGVGVLRADVWQRPYDDLPDPHRAPYSRGLVALRAHLAAAGSSTVTVTAFEASRDQVKSKTTFVVTAATEATFLLGASFWVPLASGDNEVVLTFTHTSGQLIVDSLLIYNGVKLTH